jgi:hypothetical protein
MPTYDGIGSSITHRVEVVGDSLFQDVDGGTLSTKVPVQIFSNYYASPGSVDSSRQLRFRVQPDGESNVSNSYVTDMGVKGADGSNYFFITAPQNTSNVGDQNTFVISTTGNVGIGTTDPEKPLHVVGDSWITGTLTASNIVGASPVTISSDLVMASGFTLTAGAIEPPTGSESNLKITGTITTSNLVANTGDNLLVSSNLEVGTSNLFVDTATGRVGINTTNPIDDLHVRGGITFQYGNSINATTDSQSSWTNNKVLSASWNGSQDITQLWVPGGSSASTPRITILSNGNVGVGTQSPSSPLEIVSRRTTNTWSSGQSYMNILHDNGSSAYYGMSFGVSSSRGNGCIQTFNKNSGGVAYALELQPGGGRVGIGTTVPDVPFDVYGVYSNQIAYFRYPQNPAYIRIIGDQSACLIGADGSGFSAAEPTSIAIFNTGTGYINLLTNGARRALLTGAGQFQAQSFGIYSDKRLKDNITDIDDENSLEIIRNLKPKTFVTKEIKDVKRWGFVADEVEEIVPEAIETNSSSDQYIKKSYDATWLPDGTVSALITDEVFEVGDCLKLTPDLNGLKICSVHVKSVSENVYTFEDAGCMVADDMDIKDLADDTQIHIRSKQIHNVKVLNREFIDPVMVSAMQQMLRRIESLEARLATFENNSA